MLAKGSTAMEGCSCAALVDVAAAPRAACTSAIEAERPGRFCKQRSDGLGHGGRTTRRWRLVAQHAAHHLRHRIPGAVARCRGQPEQALLDLYRARALAPNDVSIIVEVTRFSTAAGLRHYATLIQRLVEIDPLTPTTPLVRRLMKATRSAPQ